MPFPLYYYAISYVVGCIAGVPIGLFVYNRHFK